MLVSRRGLQGPPIQGLQGVPGASRGLQGSRGPGSLEGRLKGSERPEAGCLGEYSPLSPTIPKPIVFSLIPYYTPVSKAGEGRSKTRPASWKPIACAAAGSKVVP